MALPVGKGESGDSPVDPPNYEHLSTQLSALLADMVRTQEVAVAEVWSPDVRPGGHVGRFNLTRELGRGGFGVVYEALDGELSRTVALKVVRAGTRIASRGTEWLLREAEAVARLNHPNIVTLHDFGKGPTGPYLVFELLRGQSLAERLRAGPMPFDELLDVAIAVSRALVHAHGAGVIHRDLTAANVHLGEDGVVKVLDFGLAHLFGRDGANDGGTPAYMAPEQWEGDRGDGRTDLFALGVILYQALTGRFPYKVDKGWSEALEPGETPRLPRAVAPAKLRRLVRALIDREPELRPENARVVRDTLLALRKERDSAGRTRVLGAALGVAAAATATAAWLLMRHEAPPGEQVKVVVAAMENGAGDPVLDAVPGLLSSALEPSPRVKTVSASRLAYVARQAGLGELGKVDAGVGMNLARLAGAPVVLVPSAWREDGLSVLGVRAIESETGKMLFSARERLSRPSELAPTIDRLSDRVRRELRERVDDRRLRRPVAEAVTASPEAARYYYDGLECIAHPRPARGNIQQCRGYFERALALDPSFPLAHYRLASLAFLPGSSGQQSGPHLQAALDAAPRLPAREAALVKALAAQVAGRGEDAYGIYDALLATAPEDPEVLKLAADVHGQQGDWIGAGRYLEKLVAVQPDEEEPLVDLIETLGRSNRMDDLRALAARLQPEGIRRAEDRVEALVWLGEGASAVAVARQAVAAGGDAQLNTLRYALQAVGEYEEAEQVARRVVAAEVTTVTLRGPVDVALTAQGRVTEALRWHAETARMTPASDAEGVGTRQAIIAAATGSAERTWSYAAAALATNPKRARQLAVVFALLGDLPHASELADGLEATSAPAQQYRALRAWREGHTAQALAELTAQEARDPWPNAGIAPAYLIAEVCAATHDDVGTLAAVDRFQRLPPDRVWRAWAYPRSLYLAAVAHAHLGETESAKREVGRLLQLLAHADADVKLVKDARTLWRQLR